MKKFNVNVSKELARNVIYYVAIMSIMLFYTIALQMDGHHWVIVKTYKTIFMSAVTLPLAVVGLLYFWHILGFITINGKEFNDEL